MFISKRWLEINRNSAVTAKNGLKKKKNVAVGNKSWTINDDSTLAELRQCNDVSTAAPNNCSPNNSNISEN